MVKQRGRGRSPGASRPKSRAQKRSKPAARRSKPRALLPSANAADAVVIDALFNTFALTLAHKLTERRAAAPTSAAPTKEKPGERH